MIKKLGLLILFSAITVSSAIAVETSKNKNSLSYLQDRLNHMNDILDRTKNHFDLKIDNMRSSAAFDKEIKKVEIQRSKEIQKIKKENNNITLLIKSNINTVEDFLFVNTGSANTRHRFARKEFWIKKYLEKDLSLFIKYCGIDYVNISKEIVLKSTKYRLIKKKSNSPNCALVSQYFNTEVLRSYPEYIKNFKAYILEDTVISTFPYSKRFAENSDITQLAYILTPFVLNENVSDVYFHQYMTSKLKGASNVNYKIENPIVRFYFQYLKESLISKINEKITDYEDTKCCLNVNKKGKEEDYEFIGAMETYKDSLSQLKEIKEYLNKDNLHSFSKDGVFYLPIVNPETLKIEDTPVILAPKMILFYQDLENRLKSI